MRVLLVSPRSSGIGGVAQHVSKLAEKLTGVGLDVDVLSCDKLKCLRARGLANPSFALLSAAAALARRGLYDVVHAHNVPSAPAMRLAGGKRILTLHGVFSEQVAFLHGGLLGLPSGVAERVALGWADEVTAVSLETAKRYRRAGYRVHYVPNAVDLADLPGEGERLFDSQVVYVGRLSPEKGVLDLVKAFAAVEPEAHLVLVGDGPLMGVLRRVAEKNPRVHLLGYKPRSEALRIVKGSDVFVLPSRHEGLSTALLEAMALGVPCVATAVGGNVELLGGGAGVLVEPGDAAALARGISLLLSDRGLARMYSEAGFRRVLERYTWDRVLPLYLKLYGF